MRTTDKQEFFKSLGFTEYESKTLISLLKLNSATPKQIYLDSGVPQNKLYNIINKFTSLGLLAQTSIDPRKYMLVNLETFIEEKIKEKQTSLNLLKESSKNINNNSDHDFYFTLLKGQKTIMDQLAEQNPKVKREIIGIQARWKLWAKGLRQMQDAVNRGVDVKIMGIIDDETKKRAIEWKNIGCKIKAYNHKFGDYPLRFTIYDNKQARVTFGKPEIKSSKDYITIWTNSKSLIRILRKQFFEMWEESKDF